VIDLSVLNRSRNFLWSVKIRVKCRHGFITQRRKPRRIAVHIIIGTQKSMRKSRGQFVFWQSASRRRAEAALWRAAKAEGLAHSKTLRVFQESSCRAQRLGLRRPSAAFPRDMSNCANVNWNCHSRSDRYETIAGAKPQPLAADSDVQCAITFAEFVKLRCDSRDLKKFVES
jgi:hypothetical protein